VGLQIESVGTKKNIHWSQPKTKSENPQTKEGQWPMTLLAAIRRKKMLPKSNFHFWFFGFCLRFSFANRWAVTQKDEIRGTAGNPEDAIINIATMRHNLGISLK